jgi:hypothetical protein
MDQQGLKSSVKKHVVVCVVDDDDDDKHEQTSHRMTRGGGGKGKEHSRFSVESLQSEALFVYGQKTFYSLT